MRLVHYYPRALSGDGGPTRAMWEWANAAFAIGCEVAVVYDSDQEAQSSLRNPAIPLVALKHVGVGRLRVPRRLADALAKNDVLVLHSTYLPSNTVAARSARRYGVPYVVMPHGGYNRQARNRRRHSKQAWLPVERAYLERALAVHVFFESETRDAAQIAPNARWIVAPTGFDVPAARWDGGTGGYLAWLGRYDIDTKGLDLLVRALSKLPEPDRRRLRLHGKRSEDSREDVEAIARESGVADMVTVGGQIGGIDKAEFFRRAVAYVHPSRWEAQGLALVEALAYGIPSVISRSCAIAQTVQRADAAIIVEPTPDGIAHGISAILRSPQQYSDRAVQFVRTTLAWNSIIKDYIRQVDSLRAAS